MRVDVPAEASLHGRTRLCEAVILARQQIRVQQLKSFFTLLGVMIGVMFLIAVVSIVTGVSRYVEEDLAGRMLGANTFTLRRFPWFGNNTTEKQWLEWADFHVAGHGAWQSGHRDRR